MENARLVGELESRAAVEERHLLARELHDSVDQALFSLELQVGALELGLQNDHVQPEFLAQRLSQIRQLTGSAQAEMRAPPLRAAAGGAEGRGSGRGRP